MNKTITDYKIFPDYALSIVKSKSSVIEKDHESWPKIKDVYDRLIEEYKPDSKLKTRDVSTQWEGERWRCHIFHSDKGWGCVLRKNPSVIPLLEKDLGFKKEDLLSLTKGTGLILFAGASGSGKTTSMASLIDHLSTNKELGDTVTIEEPTEYVFNNPLICQREVGVDLESFHAGIHEAMRQFPKNMVIGEIRHPDTAEAAVQAGLTGHRVFATIHAENVSEACSRMFALLDDQHDELLPQALQGIVCQHLIHSVTGDAGFIYESILVTPALKSILRQRTDALHRLYGEMYAQGRENLKQQAENLCAEGRVLREEITRWGKD